MRQAALVKQLRIMGSTPASPTYWKRQEGREEGDGWRSGFSAP